MDKLGVQVMIRASIKREFCCDKDKLWDVITDNSNYSWRSDLSKIEVIDDIHFIEYTKNNYPTYFTITSKKKLKIYQFDMENTNMKGHWTGIFKILSNGNIEVEFIEEVEVSNPLMKLLAKSYLKRTQKRYIKDLEKALDRK